MRKILWRAIRAFICVILVGGLINITHTNEIQATSVKFNLQHTSSMKWQNGDVLSTVPGAGSEKSVPGKSKLVIYLSINNNSGDIKSNISFLRKEGFQYYSYYSGVLKINGVNATETQYNKFINESGVETTLGSATQTYELSVESTGSTTQKVMGDLKIQSSSVTSGRNTYTYEQVFYGNFDYPKTYTVNFYDETGSLITQTAVNQNENVELPVFTKDGYTFLGFNSLPTGKGDFFDGTNITKNWDVYATYEQLQHQVNFYVNGELYKSISVLHGDDVNAIEDPSLDNKVFKEWDGDLKNITEDREIHAVFDDKKEDKDIHIREIEVKKGQNSLETKEKAVKENASTNAFEVFLQQASPVDIVNYGLVIVLFIGIILLFIVKRRKKKSSTKT
ncbi:InlB B-repeat-containing protein [Breznakia pachnodae]|uniref:Uncharacterized protein n=1 Tax=Breznakia pachnodae TaxID=265178 RepID=A0ABU0E2L5_9FIRM|nr:InlB B-repeat-containing protein [Breznakia pachnodae]MDQ0360994.1 hypothetical protein [Breznakia pachnodae]